MKMIVVAFALVAVAVAGPLVPAEKNSQAQIVSFEFNQTPEGRYGYGYETNNGIQRKETGEVKEVLDEENKPHAVVVVRGSYAYLDNEGKSETINYYADETGYHAEGDSVPKVPVARR